MAEYHSIPKITWGSFRGRREEGMGIISGSIWESFRGRGSFRGLYSSASCQMRTLTIPPATQAREIAEAIIMQRLYGAEVGAKDTGGTLKGVQV